MSIDGKQNDIGGDVSAKVGALRYLMVMLIQRLEADGRLDTAELMAGVRADLAAIDTSSPDHAFVGKVFGETLDILQFVADVRKD
jgi:hypothetical protein